MPASSAHGRADSRAAEHRLRKHADYRRVYREGRRCSLPLMSYFVAAHNGETRLAPLAGGVAKFPFASGSRIGLTAGRVLGNAVERNRIKRRMREAIRLHRAELPAGLDVIFHPRRGVLEAEFSAIERDVTRALRAAQSVARQPARAGTGSVNGGNRRSRSRPEGG